MVHRAWADAERLSAINPLVRVPTLVLEDGTVPVDRHAMLNPINRRGMLPLRPESGVARDAALRVEGLAIDVAVAAPGQWV